MDRALDGVLFTGGNDLDPALYGQAWHPKAQHLDPDRQNFELALMAEVEKLQKRARHVKLPPHDGAGEDPSASSGGG